MRLSTYSVVESNRHIETRMQFQNVVVEYRGIYLVES
jgi:hypothetical protein